MGAEGSACAQDECDGDRISEIESEPDDNIEVLEKCIQSNSSYNCVCYECDIGNTTLEVDGGNFYPFSSRESALLYILINSPTPIASS